MLVLSRKEGEEIIIGDNIRVTVVAISGDRVRLGLTAPADISILRKELEVESVRVPYQSVPRNARQKASGRGTD